MSPEMLVAAATFAALAVLVLVSAASVRVVGPGELLVVRRQGLVTRSSGPGLAYVVPLLESGLRVDVEPRERWVWVTATTGDGVTAHLQVEFVVRVNDAAVAPRDVDAIVLGAVEDVLRREIAMSTVDRLPDVGDVPGWAPGSFVPGVLVERPVVAVCDVVVGPELRRLVDCVRP